MRNPFFDVLKFIAILLVVYGHVSGAFSCDWGAPYVGNFIVGMNMPIFFVISGYFSARTIEAGDWVKLGRHIWGYFWPVAVVSFIFAVLAVTFHLPGGEKGLIGYAGRNFLFMPWFLWCLAACFVLTFLCYRPKRMISRWIAFGVLMVLLPFVTRVWHANEIRAMLPHFLLGAFVLHRLELWKKHWIGAFCLLAYFVGVFVQGTIDTNGLSFYNMETTWTAFFSEGTSFPLYVARVVNGFVGSIGVMWLVQLLCDRVKRVVALAVFGTTTLWVYILHRWMLSRIVEFGWFNGTLACALAWSALLFLLCHLAGCAVTKCIRRFVHRLD